MAPSTAECSACSASSITEPSSFSTSRLGIGATGTTATTAWYRDSDGTSVEVASALVVVVSCLSIQWTSSSSGEEDGAAVESTPFRSTDGPPTIGGRTGTLSDVSVLVLVSSFTIGPGSDGSDTISDSLTGVNTPTETTDSPDPGASHWSSETGPCSTWDACMGLPSEGGRRRSPGVRCDHGVHAGRGRAQTCCQEELESAVVFL